MEAPPGGTAPDPGPDPGPDPAPAPDGSPPNIAGENAPGEADAAEAPEPAEPDVPAVPTAAGAHPPPSPLSGGYLLIIIGEPQSAEHRDLILQRIAKGFLSWDFSNCHVDLEKELSTLSDLAPKGEESRNGERLVQYASESLVTEVLVHPQVNTLLQCVRNLLSSFTRHRHILHAGYTFAGTGSWILQDGTFSYADLSELFHEPDVQRVLRAYENSVSVDVHCCAEGPWRDASTSQQPFSRFCRVRVNPPDVLTAGSPAIHSFIDYVSEFVRPAVLESLMEPSDVVGNIRFSHPTLYVFPGGQGDAALFGINGFNMLVDGGFGRKSCFWDFARHLDRLDAVLLTRLNNANAHGLASLLRRKRNAHVYPQIGHFFCNLQDRKVLTSPDGDKDRDNLLVSLLEEGQEMVVNLRQLQLKPSPCYRESLVEPVNLYHKVGHGKLDMYVVSPARDSKEVKEFLARWTANDAKLFASHIKNHARDFQFPLQNMVSICALLVWQPANPQDRITRILFPGSTPQVKIFEGLDKLRHLDFLKHPTCTAKSLSPSPSIVGLAGKTQPKKYTPTVIDKITPGEQQKTYSRTIPTTETGKHHVLKTATIPLAGGISDSKVYRTATTTVSAAAVTTRSQIIGKKSDKNGKSDLDNAEKVEKSEKDNAVTENKLEDLQNNMAKEEKSKTLDSQRVKVKSRHASQSRERRTVKLQSTERKEAEKREKKEEKISPTTPKKSIDAKVNGVTSRSESVTRVSNRSSSKTRRSPSATPAKSTKEANNRKVAESKVHVTRTASATRTSVTKTSKKEEISESVSKTKTIDKQTVVKRTKPVSPSKTAKTQGSPAKSQTKSVTSKVASIRKSRAVEKEENVKKSPEQTSPTDSRVTAISAVESKILDEQTQTAIENKESENKTEESISQQVADVDTNVTQEAEQVTETVEIAVENVEESTGDDDEKKSDGEARSVEGVEGDEDEEDEYLVIEKEEPYTEESFQDQISVESHAPVGLDERVLSDEDDGEDEKLKRDTQESEKIKDTSEKSRKKSEPKLTMQLTDKEHAEQIAKTSTATIVERKHSLQSPENKEKLVEEVQEIIISAAEIVSKKDEKISAVDEDKEKADEEETKSDEKIKAQDDDFKITGGKQTSVDLKEESQPDEKMSTTAESGATTAPTLPEDERIPLDEIKEVVEEKHVLEDTKENETKNDGKDEPEIAPAERPGHFEIRHTNISALHRDIIKTPDEVADLPVDEEYEPAEYKKESSGTPEDHVSRKSSAAELPVPVADTRTNVPISPDALEVVEKENNELEQIKEMREKLEADEKEKEVVSEGTSRKTSNIMQVVDETVQTSPGTLPTESKEKGYEQEKDVDTKEELCVDNTIVHASIGGLQTEVKENICVSLEELRILGHKVEDLKPPEITRDDAKYSDVEPSDLLDADVLKESGTKPKTITISSVSNTKEVHEEVIENVSLHEDARDNIPQSPATVGITEPLESVQEDVYLESSVEEEPVYGKTDSPTHPEYVTVTPDSSPEGPKSASGKRQSIPSKEDSRKSSIIAKTDEEIKSECPTKDLTTEKDQAESLQKLQNSDNLQDSLCDVKKELPQEMKTTPDSDDTVQHITKAVETINKLAESSEKTESNTIVSLKEETHHEMSKNTSTDKINKAESDLPKMASPVKEDNSTDNLKISPSSSPSKDVCVIEAGSEKQKVVTEAHVEIENEVYVSVDTKTAVAVEDSVTTVLVAEELKKNKEEHAENDSIMEPSELKQSPRPSLTEPSLKEQVMPPQLITFNSEINTDQVADSVPEASAPVISPSTSPVKPSAHPSNESYKSSPDVSPTKSSQLDKSLASSPTKTPKSSSPDQAQQLPTPTISAPPSGVSSQNGSASSSPKKESLPASPLPPLLTSSPSSPPAEINQITSDTGKTPVASSVPCTKDTSPATENLSQTTGVPESLQNAPTSVTANQDVSPPVAPSLTKESPLPSPNKDKFPAPSPADEKIVSPPPNVSPVPPSHSTPSPISSPTRETFTTVEIVETSSSLQQKLQGTSPMLPSSEGVQDPSVIPAFDTAEYTKDMKNIADSPDSKIMKPMEIPSSGHHESVLLSTIESSSPPVLADTLKDHLPKADQIEVPMHSPVNKESASPLAAKAATVQAETVTSAFESSDLHSDLTVTKTDIIQTMSESPIPATSPHSSSPSKTPVSGSPSKVSPSISPISSMPIQSESSLISQTPDILPEKTSPLISPPMSPTFKTSASVVSEETSNLTNTSEGKRSPSDSPNVVSLPVSPSSSLVKSSEDTGKTEVSTLLSLSDANISSSETSPSKSPKGFFDEPQFRKELSEDTMELSNVVMHKELSTVLTETQQSSVSKLVSESTASSPGHTTGQTSSPISASPDLVMSKRSSVDYVADAILASPRASIAEESMQRKFSSGSDMSTAQKKALEDTNELLVQQTSSSGEHVQTRKESFSQEIVLSKELVLTDSGEQAGELEGKIMAESSKLQKEAEDTEKSAFKQFTATTITSFESEKSAESAHVVTTNDESFFESQDEMQELSAKILTESLREKSDLTIDVSKSNLEEERKSGATTPSILVTACKDLARQSQPSESDTEMPEEENFKRQDDVFESARPKEALPSFTSADLSKQMIQTEKESSAKDLESGHQEIIGESLDKCLSETEEKSCIFESSKFEQTGTPSVGTLNIRSISDSLGATQDFLESETRHHTDESSVSSQAVFDESSLSGIMETKLISNAVVNRKSVGEIDVKECVANMSAVSTAMATMSVEKIEAATSPMTPLEPTACQATNISNVYHPEPFEVSLEGPLRKSSLEKCIVDTPVSTTEVTKQTSSGKDGRSDTDTTEKLSPQKIIFDETLNQTESNVTTDSKAEEESEEPEYTLVSKSVHEEYVNVSDDSEGDCKKLAATTTISTFTAKDVSDSPKHGELTKTVTTVTKMKTGEDGFDALETVTTEQVLSEGKVTSVTTKTESSPLHKRSTPEPQGDVNKDNTHLISAAYTDTQMVDHDQARILLESAVVNVVDGVATVSKNVTAGFDDGMAAGISVLNTVVGVRKDSRDATRSCTPGSDAEVEPSTPRSDMSSGQVSRAPTHLSESDYQHESEEDDIPGSPTSLTSQLTHSPPPPHFDFDIGDPHRTLVSGITGTRDDHSMLDVKLSASNTRRQTIADPMTSSVYSNLPSEPTEDILETQKGHSEQISDPMTSSIYTSHSDSPSLPVDSVAFDRAVEEHRAARGSDLTKSSENILSTQDIERCTPVDATSKAFPSSLSESVLVEVHEVQKSDSRTDTDQATSTGTASKDPIEGWGKPLGLPTKHNEMQGWGKPLGLPSPVPPPVSTDEPVPSPKGTPQKDRLGNRKSAVDNRKRPESPRKGNKPHKGNPVYIDLTYVPHHGNSYYASLEFFKRVRARYYVFSGIEPSREVYNALLEAKQSWEDKDLEVTIIPTYDTDTLGYWVAENEDALAKYKIDLSPSASRCTINLQDHETSCSAYRLEF